MGMRPGRLRLYEYPLLESSLREALVVPGPGTAGLDSPGRKEVAS